MHMQQQQQSYFNRSLINMSLANSTTNYVLFFPHRPQKEEEEEKKKKDRPHREFNKQLYLLGRKRTRTHDKQTF